MSVPLPARVDWSGTERPAGAAEVARAEGTAARIRREVAEIHTAAQDLAACGSVEVAVADFLTVQAAVLKRAGGSAEHADTLRPDEDTRE